MTELENAKAQAYSLAISAADINTHISTEVAKMVKAKKSPLAMCKEGLARLLKAGVINSADQKKLLELVAIVLKNVDGKINSTQALQQKKALYAQMLFNKTYSSTALCIINAVNFEISESKTGAVARAQTSPRQNAALGALAGGIAGGIIGWEISGGNPIGAGLGAVVGAIAGAIYGACTAD